jgi:HemY protein
MKRAILFVVLLGLVMLAAAWLAERPGTFSLVWQGYNLQAPVGVLAGAVALLAAFSAAGYAALRALVRAPRSYRRWRHDRQRRRGYAALTRGLVAVAAGDPREAQRHARAADILLNEPPLTLLLSAQAAQLANDEAGARLCFNQMLARPETEFLGLRGLINLALKRGDDAEALALARRAHVLRPHTPWLVSSLFELEARAGNWDAAVTHAAGAGRVGALTQPQVKRAQAAALVERARQRAEAGSLAEATDFARRAVEAEPTHQAAAAEYAKLLVRGGQLRRAARVVEQTWPRVQHPDLVEVYRQAHPGGDLAAWSKHVAHLASLAPDAAESRLARARAALEASHWSEARRLLTDAMQAGANHAGVFRLLARLEVDEKSDRDAERRWLAAAAEAKADPAWVCESCGHGHARWQAICRRCHSYDRLTWRSPERVQPLPILEPGAAS